MKTISALLVLIFMAACTVPDAKPLESAWQIKTGAMDDYASGRSTEITLFSEHLHYKTNGKCSVNGKKQDCMWWGAMLYYPALDSNTRLQCASTKVTRTEPDNERSLFPPSTLDYQWQIDLPAHSNKKALVFYTLPGQGDITIKTRCHNGNTELPDFSMIISLDKNQGTITSQ